MLLQLSDYPILEKKEARKLEKEAGGERGGTWSGRDSGWQGGASV